MDTHILFIFSQINYFFMFIILVLSNKGQKYCTMTHVGYNGGVMDRVSYHELTLLLLLSSSVLWECDGLPASPKPPHHNTYCQLACAIANEAPPRQTADVCVSAGSVRSVTPTETARWLSLSQKRPLPTFLRKKLLHGSQDISSLIKSICPAEQYAASPVYSPLMY